MEDRFLDAAFITSYISQGAYFIKPQTNSPYSELRALFKETGIDAYTLGLRSVAENYDNVITQQLYMLRIYGAQTVFLLIGLVSLVVFTARLYCENYKVKIAACMIEGYSLLKCIWGHIFLTLFIYPSVDNRVWDFRLVLRLCLGEITFPTLCRTMVWLIRKP